MTALTASERAGSHVTEAFCTKGRDWLVLLLEVLFQASHWVRAVEK